MNRPLTASSIVVLALLFILISSFSVHATDEPDAPIRFAIIGDRTGGHTPGIHGEIISEIDRLRPDFVMNVGDMIEGYSDNIDEIRGEWEEYLKLIEAFNAPLHQTPGNHDIWDDSTGESLRQYEEVMGPPDYSFDYRGLHIAVLDTSRWESSDELPREKLDWLAGDLEKNQDALYTIVFFHKPFWQNSLAHGKPDPLHDLFKTYGVDAVFNGHYHEYFSGEFDGIKYTSFGSSGGGMSPGLTGLEYQFGWVTVDSDGVHIALIKKDSVLPWDEVTTDDMVAVEKIEAETFQFDAPISVGADTKFENVTWEFVIKNTGKLAVSDTIHWEIPEGWTLSPDTLPVEIAPGTEKKVTVSVSCRGSLFPTPGFSLNMPYKEGGTYELTRYVMVTRQTLCTRTEQEPNIDGKVDESDIWKQPEERFFGPEGGDAETEANRFYFAYDEKNLYLATVIRESELENMRTSATTRDGLVYKNDYVGFFLAPPGEEDATDIYLIYFNPNGVIFDQKILYAKGQVEDVALDWNTNCEVETTKENGIWSLEARIPLKDLGVAEVTSGDRWRVNFRRKQQRMETSANWMVPITYYPETYGEMVFE
jgi:hypothetical protein